MNESTRKPRSQSFYIVTGPEDSDIPRLVKAGSSRSAIAHVAAKRITARKALPEDLLRCGNDGINVETAGESDG